MEIRTSVQRCEPTYEVCERCQRDTMCAAAFDIGGGSAYLCADCATCDVCNLPLFHGGRPQPCDCECDLCGSFKVDCTHAAE